jgi:mutator protein MutT
MIGAIAVVPRDGAVVMVRRTRAPASGLWGFPGGHVEWGETVAAAAIRELREETGIVAVAERPLGLLDAIGAAHHYVLAVTLCRWQAGDPVAGDDAAAAEWVPLAEAPARETVGDVGTVLGWLDAAQVAK